MDEFMTGAEAVVRCINNEDVKHVFCVPGESYLEIMDVIYDVPELQLISARHEGGAAFMAEAYAKASRNVSVAMATRGVGAANLSIGVHTALQDSTPMVVFLGQVDRKYRGREGFQEVELDRFFEPISKWSVEIREVERIPELVQRAFRVAKSGRPGPVVVSLPADILSENVKMKLYNTDAQNRNIPSEEGLNRCIEMILQSKKPLILAGGGIKLSNAEQELLAFAEALHIPVLTSFRRHDVFPNKNKLYLGHLGLGTFDEVINSVKQSDLMIAIGTRFSEVTTQSYTLIESSHRVIHCDIDPNSIGKVYSPHLALIGDAKATLSALKEKMNSEVIKTLGWKDWVQSRRKEYDNITSLNVKKADNMGVEMKKIMQRLQETLPEDAIITNDAGNFAGWLHNYFQFSLPNTYIGPTSGAMGYGLPAAIGAKLACPDRTVVSLSGDGGFMMTLQELETAVRYKIPIVSLVFNNNMHGTIRMHQEKHFPNRVIGTELGNPDFVKLSESMGVFGQRVKNNDEFGQTLKEALKSQIPSLIEVVCDPEKISVNYTISELRKIGTR
ncbi:thiamine pyrophosphate-dependent enzyme [Chengkuizengella axinellae]|uniref:Thiamine pyrophosphate-binding protein n=1 Tax=Chengkuizengella axinellae TaxID=3064388 RepID=A0ABT9J1J8_9BACL|nr:thiamine pyrophosphate-dependent enzyme [Chengkuizengella sp. 2205SS18-9]MDP5275472.1 thiamine pyrophosphate-binding protein [Chengkuizengella sp. 2205SS18-9]